jgi:hypothetical protein
VLSARKKTRGKLIYALNQTDTAYRGRFPVVGSTACGVLWAQNSAKVPLLGQTSTTPAAALWPGGATLGRGSGPGRAKGLSSLDVVQTRSAAPSLAVSQSSSFGYQMAASLRPSSSAAAAVGARPAPPSAQGLSMCGQYCAPLPR